VDFHSIDQLRKAVAANVGPPHDDEHAYACLGEASRQYTAKKARADDYICPAHRSPRRFV
jgi:hypothetical protein